MTAPTNWEIPPKIWAVLASWGLGVLVLAGLLSAWIWSNEREAADERAELQREQDRAMCAMIHPFLTSPEPPSGPEGDRSREILAGIREYSRVLHCEDFATEPPVSPRPR